MALDYLLEQGYRLLERNYHWGHLEIDLIMVDGDFIVFVEVKTRKNSNFGEPESFVNLQKQRNIIRAANGYVNKMGIGKEVRFDVVSVIVDEGPSSIKHLKDCFKPRW